MTPITAWAIRVQFSLSSYRGAFPAPTPIVDDIGIIEDCLFLSPEFLTVVGGEQIEISRVE